MHTSSTAARRQRGMTFFGLLFWGVVVALLALLVMKSFPYVNEYYTIKRTVQKVADEQLTSVPAIRTSFERQKSVEYSISSIGGKDLEIEAVGDKFVISFAYDAEVEVIEPVFLLFKFRGRSR